VSSLQPGQFNYCRREPVRSGEAKQIALAAPVLRRFPARLRAEWENWLDSFTLREKHTE
jgi:hypothetical protein